MTAPLPPHLAKRVQVNPSPCWSWIGGSQTKGYGSLTDGNGGTMLAHRAAWEAAYGPIPDGLTVNHICRNHLCVRPDHLELQTAGDNLRHARNAIPVCPAGHEYDDENTIVNRHGHRSCRACANNVRRVKRATS